MPVTPHAHLGRVVLVRHGESVANAAGMFTGVLDVPLSERGVREAHRAAELVAATGIRFDLALTSELERAWATADVLASSDSAGPHLPPVERTWLLNERTYGALTGRTKADVCAEVGETQFLAWRRSVRVPPPAMGDDAFRELAESPLFRRLPAEALVRTESLADVMVRVGRLWRERVDPVLRRGGSVLLVAHGNSLRALCGVVDALDDVEIQQLGLPTGHPLLYELDPDGAERDGLLVPLVRGGVYLDEPAALAAAERLAREGGT
ncbi:2,3-bisphosphoglycerate-dependent phosphoglycerate mutase [Litorihabitans aurantiacus]|uniref:2,3-bisphosphoglycerate-dependent phosphoglycerate mutase n=1 Tax=Litorihabitans aurantiacus TaxID=1930061 RepID=A0AA38CQZ1_9MICO|nr:2,3-bisphosphoglycerate-dependent phosphoglycerate mutase [Litorihabitans aurantiacus]GMA31541.1 2,3-bisphosphoglycerate-dependent phosphoglycerate mutase [Litorihabitans aurantiacus]